MKKFLTIVLAIVMVAMMFVMVGCGKTVDNNNEDGSTNNNDGNNSVIDTDKNNNNKTEEIVDKVYIPDTENLVGIGVYPVKDGEKYPYVEGQKITDFSDWKFLYVDGEVGTSETTKVVFDNTVVGRDISVIGDDLIMSADYEANNLAYWGYIYNNNGEIYLVATEDISIDPTSKDVQEVSCIDCGDWCVELDCRKLRYDVEPTHYQYVFQIDDVKDENGWYVGRTVYSSEIYTIDTLPTEITFEKEPWVNFVAINLIANDEVLYTQKIAYYSETPYVGNPGTTVMLDLYKDGESYQHVVTVNREK